MSCDLLDRWSGPASADAHANSSKRRCSRSAANVATVRVPALPRRRLPLTWRRLPWWGELLTIGCFYVLYEAVRAVTPSDALAAGRHADDILDLEHWAHVQVELTLNRALSSTHLLATLAAGYYTTLHFVVTPLMLVYLWRRQPGRYPELRSALVLTSIVALVVFWTWPVAPPRFAIEGASDTLVNVHLIGSANPHGVVSLINEYAAMPSLHVGWAVWCAFAVVCTSRSRWRYLAWLYPTATSLVVIATANHYVLDVLAGGLLTAACLALTLRGGWAEPKRPARGDRSGDHERQDLEDSPEDQERAVESPDRVGTLQPAH
jgi:hypothetical protein